jgi:hypothetical protein
VPKDLKLTDGKATCTITVTYDTAALYGKVQATRTIDVVSPESK